MRKLCDSRVLQRTRKSNVSLVSGLSCSLLRIQTPDSRLLSSSQVRRYSATAAVPPNNPTASSDGPKRKAPSADDDDFLSKHGGKIAIGALGVSVWLIYTYYLGIQDRNAVEHMIETYDTVLEPYEQLDLRYCNQIEYAQFEGLVRQLLKDSDSILQFYKNTAAEESESHHPTSESKGRTKFDKIPFLTYEQLVALIYKHQGIFHQNHPKLNVRLYTNNVIFQSHYLDRVLYAQLSKDLVGFLKVPLQALPPVDDQKKPPTSDSSLKLPFSINFNPDPLKYQLDSSIKKSIDEDAEKLVKKGQINLSPEFQELFRLYPSNVMQEYANAAFLSAEAQPNPLPLTNYQQIPVKLDYFLVVLTMLMQTQQWPENIQQRLRALFLVAGTMQYYQTQGEQQASSNNESALDGLVQNLAEQKIPRDVMLRLIYLLQLTNQFPCEKQIIETGVKWPVKLYRRKTPSDMIKVFEENRKVPEIKEWNLQDFESLLISNFNCIWGTCYNEKKALIKTTVAATEVDAALNK